MLKTPATTASFLVVILAGLISAPLLAQADKPKKAEEKAVGTTAQKLKIEYQSAKDDGSRIYRVRNTADGLKTEVEWKDDADVFVHAVLVKCKEKTKSCNWVEAIVPSESVTTGETSFGYGLNANQYVDKPDAFRRDAKADDKPVVEAKKPLTSRLKGSVETAAGNVISLDVTVTSEYKDDVLIYSVTVEKDASELAIIKKDANPPSIPFLVWESAQSEQFDKKLKDLERLRPIVTNSKPLKITVPYVKETPVVSRKLLKVMVGDEVIAATSAPAYVPKKQEKDKKPGEDK